MDRRIAIAVVSHLDFSKHLIKAAERITGRQKNLIAINLPAKQSPAQLSQRIARTIASCFKAKAAFDGLLILTDLFGSTPTNVVLSQVLKLKKPIEICSGMNLPMLLSALFNRDKLTLKELSYKVLSDGKKGIRDGRSHFSGR